MVTRRVKNSFYHAGKGFWQVAKTELNFRVELILGLLVIIGLIYFRLPLWQSVIIILLITVVLVMELLNTAFEYMADLLKPRLHHYVAIIKDVLAAAVLVTALGSAVIGILIFWPYFVTLFR